MKDRTATIQDEWFKWIGIPVVGISIFYLSGFHLNNSMAGGSRIPDFLYFSLISAALWHANTYAQFLVRDQLAAIRSLYHRLPLRFAVTFLISWTISWSCLNLWNHFIKYDRFTDAKLASSQWMMVIACILISSIYEIIHLNRERESDIVQMERTEKLKVQAQLDALKSQIDPHFIFNSLNTLSYLIGNEPAKAKLFNDTLAKVYRYILLNKEKDVVALKEEIEFASNYFYLLKIRYQTGLSMRIRMDDIITGDYLIPPLSLQALIENAIKHNHFSEKMPLSIDIVIGENEISVMNAKSPKKFDIISSRIGLSNLNERYSLIVNRNITVVQNPKLFTVLLPILKS